MYVMEHQYPNFLAPEPNLPDEPQKKSRRGLFFILFIVFLLMGALVTHALLPEDTGSQDPLQRLEAKKPTGILGKLKQFIFNKGSGELEGQKEDRIDVLILGQGGPGHDGPYLTDTIIVASFKPSTKQVAMMSIPRDLLVSIPGYGNRKINSANAFAEAKNPDTGPELTQTVIENTFDIDIDYYVRVDFSAFEDLVDKVGGVTINVEQSFTDPEYPVPGKEDAFPISSRYKTLKFTSGVQTMNGATALEYARSRHGNNGEGNDYARSRRQQKVLLALKEKLFSFQTLANPVTLNDILSTAESHILTDLTIAEMITFGGLGSEINTKEILNLTLDDSPAGFLRSGYDVSGAFVLTPKTDDFASINTAFKNIFNPTTSSTHTVINTNTPPQEPAPESAAILEVHNATWAPGLAAQVKTRLEQKQFVVGMIGNSINRPQPQSAIYKVNPKADKTTLEKIQKELGFPVKTQVPTGENYANTTDILIVLGEDFGS